MPFERWLAVFLEIGLGGDIGQKAYCTKPAEKWWPGQGGGRRIRELLEKENWENRGIDQRPGGGGEHVSKMPAPGDFPGGMVAKTPHSQCRVHGFKPWSGN